MDPFTIAALVSGAGGALSSIFGGMAQSQQTALQNALLQQQLADSKLGQTDARGNRTYFKDGIGWVTEYGPTDRALEAYFLNRELPERQSQFQRAAVSSRNESAQADALLREFQRIERMDPNALSDLLFSQAARGVGENTQNANNVLMRNILRTGATSNGKMVDQINKAANDSLAGAAVDSKLKAMDFSNSKFASDRSNTSSLYNLFANRARQSLDATTGATTPATTSAAGSNIGLYNAGEADTGWANALGGAAASIGGAFNSYGASQQNNQTNALLQQFLTGGGQLNLNNGGIFGTVAERSRRQNGAF
jgi:hypothetical protein